MAIPGLSYSYESLTPGNHGLVVRLATLRARGLGFNPSSSLMLLFFSPRVLAGGEILRTTDVSELR